MYGVAAGSSPMHFNPVRGAGVLSVLLFVASAFSAEPPKGALQITVRSTEIDANGHVNNARYIEYLQWGRWEWLEANRFDYDTAVWRKAVPVVVRIDITFRLPCHRGERLRVVTVPKCRGESRFVLEQTIEKVDGKVAAYATVTMVTVDPSTKKSCPLPEQLANLFPAKE